MSYIYDIGATILTILGYALLVIVAFYAGALIVFICFMIYKLCNRNDPRFQQDTKTSVAPARPPMPAPSPIPSVSYKEIKRRRRRYGAFPPPETYGNPPMGPMPTAPARSPTRHTTSRRRRRIQVRIPCDRPHVPTSTLIGPGYSTRPMVNCNSCGGTFWITVWRTVDE